MGFHLYRATKERRRERQEYVYMHRIKIKRLINSNDKRGIDLFVKSTRQTLGYSKKTASCDIWCSLVREYRKVINR